MKYINADELKGIIHGIMFHSEKSTITREAIEGIIDNVCPSANVVEAKHGKWQRTNPMTDTVECSLCHYQIISEELITPFCSWCGADMRGEENG